MKSDASAPRAASVPAFGAVLREYRGKAGLSQKELADRMGVTRNTVVNWEADRCRPDFSVVPRLCTVLRLPLHRLFAMEESGSSLSPGEERILSLLRQLSPSGFRLAENLITVLAGEEAASRERTLRESVRLFEVRPGSVAAGSGADVADMLPSFTFLRISSLNAAADGVVRVSGDSMEPVYHDGDYVYYQLTESTRPGMDVIVDTDDGAVIKRLAADRTLYSVNTNRPYGPKNDQNTLVIRGRVLGVVSSSDYLSGEELRLAEEIFESDIRSFRRKYHLSEWD